MPDAFEGTSLEFKETVENYRDISKTACAFANAYGGQIKIGVTDNGKPIGVDASKLDELQKRLEGAIKVVSPTPLHTIDVQTEGENKIIVVDISRMGEGSLCTFNGVVHYRVGSRNEKLEGATLRDYLIHRKILIFDDTISQASISDLDPDKLREYLKVRTPDIDFKPDKIDDYLLNLGLAKKNGKVLIKNATILLFAKSPSRFLPQNELRLVKFKGNQAVEIIDSRSVNLTIPDNLKEAETFIQKNTKTRVKIEKLQREEVPEYPQKVIREALVNAIAHRDYFSRDNTQINIFDDRIEFLNPGKLPDGLSLEILGGISIKRNPLTYLILKDLHFMEGIATGIPRMRAGMKEAGLPAPKFEELGSFFKVTLFSRSPIDTSNLNERQKMLLAYLEKYPSIKAKKYQKITKVSHPMAVADLNEMILMGLIKKIGKTRGAYYTLATST